MKCIECGAETNTKRKKTCSEECKRARTTRLKREWYKKNPQKQRAWSKAWREKNIEHVRLYEREYMRKRRLRKKLEEAINLGDS